MLIFYGKLVSKYNFQFKNSKFCPGFPGHLFWIQIIIIVELEITRYEFTAFLQ
jgi:hypothetical protein